jgi:catechol 2,3-dioxygenase-like lactoylglutathione lyase family enzyme
MGEKNMTVGMPGLRGADHLGITVPNLEEAIDFFTRVIGCEYIYYGGESGDDPTFMVERLNVHPQASNRYCFLRCGNGYNLQLFEYSSPDQVQTPPKNSDIGGHHIALYVDNIHTAVKHLRANGVKVFGDPMTIVEGPSAGAIWVYFLAPWGLQMELCCYPQGKAYSQTAKRLLWDPRAQPGGSDGI